MRAEQMQTYARIDADGQVTQWPVLEAHIKARGLPMRFFDPVIDRPAPEHNALTHSAARRTPIRDDAGRLVQDWEIVALPFEAVKDALIGRLAEMRWKRETGGLLLPTGQTIGTTREAQAQISSALMSLQGGLITSVDWKLGGEWVTLTLDQFAPMAAAVANHVQRCFAAEKAVTDLIGAAIDVEELAGIDLAAEFEDAYSGKLG